MTEREAMALATELNKRPGGGGSTGFYAVIKTGRGDNDYTVQSSEQAAMERAGLTQQAEQNFQPGTACPAQCAAMSVAVAVVVGDVSDSSSSDANNNAKDIAEASEKAVKILGKAPNKDVANFAKGMKVLPGALKAAAVVPAAVNNYQQCMANCTEPYMDRPSTESKRGQ